MDERLLVNRVLEGDEAAFDELYQSHKRRLERTAIHFLGASHPSLDDVLQETFMAALPKLAEFRFESTLYTWLNRFVVNFCFQAMKKGKKQLPTETEDMEAQMAPLAKVEDPDLSRILNEELAKLSDEHREAIQLRDIEGHSYLEIAKTLKLAPGTVMSRLARARSDLRERLSARDIVLKSLWKGQ